MKGFALGLLVASLGWGAVFYLRVYGDWKAPDVTSLTGPDAGAARTKTARRRRRAVRKPVAVAAAGNEAPPVVATAPEEDNEPEPMELSSTDLRSVGRGDDLSTPDVLELDMSKPSSLPELTQDDIDAKFRARQNGLLECITKARPDEVTFIPGRVTVKFRIQRNGSVRGVRVDAPSILQQGGLYPCIKNIVGGLRFPASNGSQVVTYPFTLS